MEFLIYRSTALVAPDAPESGAILEAANRRNMEDGLTGFLYREADTFIQYLEGARRPLWACFDRIAADERHTGLVLLGSGVCRRRLFADWRMGYADETVASFVDFLDESAAVRDVTLAPTRNAVAFMRGVSQRVDLGITCRPALTGGAHEAGASNGFGPAP